jgi:hypothetical protein
MSAALVALFAPYCEGVRRAAQLEQALALLASGGLQGQRPLRPQGQRPFELRWRAGIAPLEAAEVQLLVEGQPGADYSFDLPTHQLVLWLMDWLDAGGPAARADLPESFWRWLLLGLDPGAAAS